MAFGIPGILDNFNRANTGPPPSSSWTTPTGASGLKVVSNVCAANAANGVGIYNVATYGPDCDCYFTVTTAAGSGAAIGVYARCKDISSGATLDGYFVVFTEAATDTWLIRRADNGTPVTLGAGFNQEVSNGDSIGIRCIGSSIQAWYKASGGSWTMLAERTDSTYTAAGYLGISLTDTTARVDDFGGGTYTPLSLNCAAGSYSITGAAATLLAARKLTLSAGAYIQSGAADTFLRTRIANLAAGSYAQSGAAASLLHGYTLVLTAGNYALTGQAASLLATHILNLAAGNYALSGKALTALANRILSLSAGTYAASGAAAELRATRLLTLAAGAYIQSGADNTLLHSFVLTLTAGGYVLTGADATLTHAAAGAYIANLQAGAYSVTGASIGILIGRVMSLAAGDYILSGKDAGLTVTTTSAEVSGPYFYELPRKREVMSNKERAAILASLLVVLDD